MPAYAASYRARVVQHLPHGDGQSVFIAQHHHAERVADQDHVNAGVIQKPRTRIVVGGQTSDDFLTLFFFEKGGRSDLRAEVPGGNTQDVLQCSSATCGYRLYQLNSTPARGPSHSSFDVVRCQDDAN